MATSVRVQSVESAASRIDGVVNQAIEALEAQGHRVRDVQFLPLRVEPNATMARAVIVFEIPDEPTPPSIG